MAKVYVIREAEFFYTDECFVPEGWTRVVERHQDQAAAEARAKKLCRANFGMVTSSLADWTFDDEDKERAVLQLAKEHFPQAFARAVKDCGDDGEPYRLLQALNIPDRTSDAVKDELLELIGARFYGVFAFDGEPVFHQPELNPAFFADGADAQLLETSEGFPCVFNTRDEALSYVSEILFRVLHSDRSPPGLQGSYEALSESPEALATLVESGIERSKPFKKTASGIAIATSKEAVFRRGIVALAPLLKEPPFWIKLTSFEHVQGLDAGDHDDPEDDESDDGEPQTALEILQSEQTWAPVQLKPAQLAVVHAAFGKQDPATAAEVLDRLIALVLVLSELQAKLECDYRMAIFAASDLQRDQEHLSQHLGPLEPHFTSFCARAFAELRAVTELGAILQGCEGLMIVASSVAELLRSTAKMTSAIESDEDFEAWASYLVMVTRATLDEDRERLLAALPVGSALYDRDLRCPKCDWQPNGGAHWGCDRCDAEFDTFKTGAKCPACPASWKVTWCPSCNKNSPFKAWDAPKK